VRRTEGTPSLLRVDWRFIVGAPRFASVAYDADHGIVTALRSIADEVVELAGARRCDLVVLTNPTAASLARARQSLRPGGACYCEWTLPLPGALRRARRRLEAVGFSDVQAFWPWPPPSRAAPAFWLPLDDGRAVSHFLATRPRAPTAPARAADAALRAVWRLARRAELVAPLCVVARKPPLDREDSLAVLLRRGWAGWGLGAPPAHLPSMLLTGGPRTINKVVLLVFPDEQERPALAVKLARVPATAPIVAREAAVLARLPRAARRAEAGIPELIFHERLAGFEAMGQRAVEGDPLDRVLDARSYRRIALRMTGFLTALADSGPHVPRDEWWDRLVGSVIARFDSGFGSIVGRARVSAAEAVLAGLPALPLAFEHRDCGPENILVGRDGGIAVLDWEFAEPRGLPLLDLVYFSGRVAIALERTMGTRRERASYARVLDPKTFTGGVFAQCVARYIGATGVDPAAVAPLRLLTWMRCACWQRDLMVEDAGGGSLAPADEGGGNGSAAMLAFVDAWQEEVDRAVLHVGATG
jgi:hypothetical protein